MTPRINPSIPPATLLRLFDQETRDEARLRATRAKLDAAIQDYSRSKGLKFMRKESVRAEVQAV